ncbi:MAG: PAS domain-containing sensor histidine kinase [Synechococcus sp. Baikal-G1]|nr:MAG: PAS domain-containing sensor histidine kinase [Synechococcus sp. Baikal-G1]
MALLLALFIGLALGYVLAREPNGRPAAKRPRRSLPSRQRVKPAQLQAWIEAAPVGWLSLDAELRIHDINPRAEKLLKLPPTQLTRGRLLSEAVAVAELEAIARLAQAQERPQRVEWQIDSDALEAYALPGEEGWVALLLQSRRSLEAQLEQQERWVSDVAHELKTPLTALLLVGESLASQVEDRHGLLVQRLQRELQRLQELVSDLLELSRLENLLPREEGRYDQVELRELVEAAWASLRPLAEQRQIELALAGPSPCPARGDGPRLHRALLNLLDNALRYSPEGSAIEVGLRSSGDWWLIDVRDHGMGLSDEDRSHMFERFYRGDPSRVRSQRAGSGLGLAIVQQIAVTHGGRIQGRNHPQGGTVMELVLPKGD